MSSSQESTFERLQRILAKEFEVASDIIIPTARLDSLGIDSLAVIEVIFRLEDEFKISFSQEPGDLPTIADLVSAIDQLVAQRPAQAPLKPEVS